MTPIRPSVEADVYNLAPRLRADDVRELLASSGKSPEASLLDGFRLSTMCRSIVSEDGLVLAMYGAVPSPEPAVGIVWMLASPELLKRSREFIRRCRHEIDKLFVVAPILANYVDERNAVHIRWLQWCGFTFPGHTIPGPNDPSVNFKFFYKEKIHV